MSALPPPPDAQEFARARRAFDAPSPPVVALAPRCDLAALRRRLQPIGIDYSIQPDVLREYQCGPVRLVSCSAVGGGRGAIARFAAAVARFYGCTQPFTLVLALVERPLVLAFDRPLTRRDVNSGATWTAERLTVLWRWSSRDDFYKVLAHELTHLITGNTDEADVEARALRLMCMRRARTLARYRDALGEERERLHALGAQLEHVDVGDTNASLYWQEGSCLLDGGAAAACRARPQRHAASGEGGVQEFRVYA